MQLRNAKIYRPSLIYKCSLHEFARDQNRKVADYKARPYSLKCNGTLRYQYEGSLGLFGSEYWAEETHDIDKSFAKFVWHDCQVRRWRLPDAVVEYNVETLRRDGLLWDPLFKATGKALWKK